MAEPEESSARSQEVVQFKGSCACARISYQCSGLPNSSRSITACHCVTCRKVSGGPYQAYVDVKASSVTFFDHKEALQYEGLPKDKMGGITFIRFSKVGERAYCATCNTPLAMRYKIEMDVTALALGAVDEQSLTTEAREALRLTTHIFTSQKAWWLDIKDDGLIKHDRFKGDFETQMLQYESELSGEGEKA